MMDNELGRAIDEENLDVIRGCLARGSSPDSPVDEFDSPLVSAARSGTLKVIDLLLDEGAQVDMSAPSGLLPLCGAIANGKLSAVKKLIKRVADVNAQDGDPLRSAVYHQQYRCVCALLEAGASPNPRGFGLSPLRSAVGHKSKRGAQIVEALIQAGADVNEGPQTPLMRACDEGTSDMVRLLIAAGADVNAFDDVLGTALMGAAFDGRADLVQILLEAGADPSLRFGPDHRDSANMTAYDVAVWQKKKKVAMLLKSVEEEG